MNEAYQREKRIFLGAVELEGAERSAYLDEACGDDAALRDGVESLLAADESLGASLDESPRIEIEGFRLLRQIGSGGMGIVFEAEQANPQRRVALKVLRYGIDDDELARRFRYESEILGSLDHPSIARIYAAGVARGQPWFAMELVDGTPLTEAARKLDKRAKLELLVQICRAVQHAHRRGIVHRDLKPGNILVDGRGEPRLLDFGIAKTEAQQHSLATRAGQLLGTVPYMSPEQIGGDPQAVDVRADVYSLGVVAYELLAGRLPLELDTLSLTDALLAVRREEPPTLGSIDTKCRGDLETIVGKALAKEPERRYENAGALGNDIQRYLDDETILARRPTTGYQLRKFVRRNRALVAGVAATMLALIGGLIGMSLYAAEANEQRGKFEAERNEARTQEQRANDALEEARIKAQAVSETLQFVMDVFYAGDPGGTRELPPIKLLLDRATERVMKVDMEPRALVHVTHTIGFIQNSLGQYENARRLFEKSVELARAMDDDTRLAHDLMHLGAVRGVLGDAKGALAALDEAASLLSDASGEYRASCHSRRARVLATEQRFGEAKKEYERALDLAETDVTRCAAWGGLADVATAENDLERAQECADRCYEVSVRCYGKGDPRTRPALAVRASLLGRRGKANEAVPVWEELIRVETERWGAKHRNIFMLRNNLSTCLMRAGRNEEAVRNQAALLKAAEGEFDPEGEDIIHMLFVLVSARRAAKQYEGLEPSARRVAEFHARRYTLNSNRAQSSMHTWADTLSKLERNEEAAATYARAAQGASGIRKINPEWEIAGWQSAAMHYFVEAKWADVVRCARAALAHRELERMRAMLAHALLERGETEQAGIEARKAYGLYVAAKRPTHRLQLLLARIEAAKGNFDRALKLADGAVRSAPEGEARTDAEAELEKIRAQAKR